MVAALVKKLLNAANNRKSKFMELDIGLLLDKDPRNRLSALRDLTDIASKLSYYERESIVEQVGKLAEDEQPFIRWNVAYALGKIGHEKGIRILEKLTADEHANVRFRVAYSLGLIGNELAIPILEKMTSDTYKIGEHAVIRAYAVQALAKFQHETSVKALGRLVEDEDPVVRWHVAVALGDIGLESGVQYLAKLVNDKIPFVRAHTAIALAQIGHESGLEYIEKLAKDDMERVAKISFGALKLLKSMIDK